MHSFDVTLENLSKIEGHTDLEVQVRKGKVEKVALKVTENKRFYTQAIRGKPAVSAPHLMCRICGTCSIAHLLCCIKAVEKALGVKVSRQTTMMRKLAMYGLHLRDHALHCYFFSLPDIIGKDSILDFDEDNEYEHTLIHQCFDVKAAGNALSTLICGKPVHGPYPEVGGFMKYPTKAEVKKVVSKLKKARQAVLDLIKVFLPETFSFHRKTDYVSLINADFNFYEGKNLCSSRVSCIQESDFDKHFLRKVLPYSQASAYTFRGKTYMVGALSRLNLNKKKLHKNTRRDAKEALKVFPSTNTFFNNLAQCIEMLHCIDHSLDLLTTKTIVKEERRPVPKQAGRGVGVVEAPRGTLYYYVDVDSKGIITHADIVVPSGQNHINMEQDIKSLVEENLALPKKKLQFEIEKLIRAYDPCMSCAAHFLKLKFV